MNEIELPPYIKIIVVETARDWPKFIGPNNLVELLDKMAKRICNEIYKEMTK